MHKIEKGRGLDQIGVINTLGIQESCKYETEWRIHRFDEEVYEKKVKRLWSLAGEAFVLANYYMHVGNIKEALKKFLYAKELIQEGEAYAYSLSLIPGNVLLNEGINSIWTLVCGGSETAFNNVNARLGVGDSTTAEAAAQTDLQAVTNKLYKAMDSGYPTFGTNQKGTWKSTFGGTEANFGWNEFTVDNGGTAQKNLNRKVSAQGTKISGQVWALTLDITLS